jgi:hypothetical protein
MPANWTFDDEGDRQGRAGEDDVSFAAWLMSGACLALAYVLALVLLHPHA